MNVKVSKEDRNKICWLYANRKVLKKLFGPKGPRITQEYVGRVYGISVRQVQRIINGE